MIASQHWLHFARHTSVFVIALFAVPLGLLASVRQSVIPSPARPFAVATLLFVGANIGVYALTTAETRYRLYVDPLFNLWAWIAVSRFVRGNVEPETSDQRCADRVGVLAEDPDHRLP